MSHQSQPQARVKFLTSIRELLPSFNLPLGSYVIAGSGPMAVRGIRDAVDIDILVNESLWNSLVQRYKVIGANKNEIVIGRVEIWKDWMNLTAKIDEMIENCEMIEGFPFMKLSYVIDWKLYLGRPKDIADIALLKDYLYTS